MRKPITIILKFSNLILVIICFLFNSGTSASVYPPISEDSFKAAKDVVYLRYGRSYAKIGDIENIIDSKKPGKTVSSEDHLISEGLKLDNTRNILFELMFTRADRELQGKTSSFQIISGGIGYERNFSIIERVMLYTNAGGTLTWYNEKSKTTGGYFGLKGAVGVSFKLFGGFSVYSEYDQTWLITGDLKNFNGSAFAGIRFDL